MSADKTPMSAIPKPYVQGEVTKVSEGSAPLYHHKHATCLSTPPPNPPPELAIDSPSAVYQPANSPEWRVETRFQGQFGACACAQPGAA